jgi:hypothetical protein
LNCYVKDDPTVASRREACGMKHSEDLQVYVYHWEKFPHDDND